MQFFRKMVSCLLSICIFACVLPILTVNASASQEDYRWITDREEVDGSDFTSSAVLAAALNDIFDGDASIYYDAGFTKLVNTELGSSRVPNNGVNKYVGPYGDDEDNVGTSCWIYANGVYYTLFGEATGCGTAGENSEKLNLKTTANRNLSYENMKNWGVHPGVGALVRTQCGHSLIVLGYDEERITILDGNGNGKGLVAIRVITWDRIGFRAQYIIQPKLERLPLQWLWKAILFNMVSVILYAVLLFVFGMRHLMAEFQELGMIGLVITLILGNVCFFMLDRLLHILSRKFSKRK